VGKKRHSIAELSLKRVGLILVFLSFFLYGLIFLLPFLHLSLIEKGTIASVLVILGEISFWIGGIILYKQVTTKVKHKDE